MDGSGQVSDRCGQNDHILSKQGDIVNHVEELEEGMKTTERSISQFKFI
jgi:hypothetical protein